MYFGGHRQSTVIGYGCPDLVKISTAYGLKAASISSLDGSDAVMEKFLATEETSLLEVKLALSTWVNPKLVVNRPIEDMSPFVERGELRAEMLIELVTEQDMPT
jgi:acetolactate synthase-1/2/3 large subunit